MDRETHDRKLDIPAGTWRLDPAESTIAFRVASLPPAKGRFSKAKAVLDVHPDGSASAAGSIEVASLSTGLGLRDRHLRSGHFFDSARHPTISFESASAHIGADHVRLDGDLTIVGHRRAVRLEGHPHPTDAPRALRLHLRGELDRHDFGVEWMGLDRMMIGRRVKLELNLLVRR